MRAIYSLATALVAGTVLSAQTAPKRMQFEVASVKPSPPIDQSVKIGVHLDGSRIFCTALSLKDYLRMAYDVKDFQIQAPEWMASLRYDIAATLPAGAPASGVREMIQSLLADRFHLAFHRESKEFAVYGLVVGKDGAKLKESKIDPDTLTADASKPVVNVAVSGGRGGMNLNLGNGSAFAFGNNKIEGTKLTMLAFADTIARFVDRPVVDMTNLKGNYDFTIEITPEDFHGMTIRSAIAAGVSLPPEVVKQALEGGAGDSFFSAIQTLGLRLDRRKAPLEVLVIDRADKDPTDN
jgi:uncharacterized protein (TIGR03435 family)